MADFALEGNPAGKPASAAGAENDSTKADPTVDVTLQEAIASYHWSTRGSIGPSEGDMGATYKRGGELGPDSERVGVGWDGGIDVSEKTKWE